jgi:serine/threonine-protein kinase
VQAEATQDPLLGVTLADRYHIVRCIGKGGMGVVYEAMHVALGKRVAIKLLLDKYENDTEAVERFHREALTATQIGDDHIIDVIDVGATAQGRSFVVLELLDGQDLGKLLAATGPMPASRAVHIIQQVLRGLGAAHAKGIVHRDMKPDNVFVVPHSETPDFVKILDFGISKIIAAQDAKVRLTATGTVVGTPIYMAPEQAMGNSVDHRADLYSVGVMLYELLAGRPPFVAESYLALVTQHLQAVPPDLGAMRPDLPRPLVNAIHRALAKEPDQRYRSAEEFARALPAPGLLRTNEGLGVTYGSGSLPIGQTPGGRAVAAVMGPSTAHGVPARVRARRRWILGTVLGAAAAAAAVAAIVVATRGGGAPGAAAATHAALRIETDPPGVQVFVDDALVGATPVILDAVELGKHRVRFERDGYVSVSTTKVVSAGENASLFVSMTQAQPQPPTPTPTPAPTPDPPVAAPERPSTPVRETPRKTHGVRSGEKAGTGGPAPVDPYDGGPERPVTTPDPPAHDDDDDKPKRDPGDRKTKPNPYD